jgi:3-phenylpropionate/trans-cinnamate dioxygenase ferredoxin reductase component
VRRVVIVGGSAAGLATAEALRRFGFDGEIAIVDREEAHGYDRPPLSKQVLSGEWPEERAQVLSPARAARIEAEFLAGVAVTGLDLDARRLSVDDGSSLAYDELVIATGVSPRHLPGDGHPDLHVLRSLDDSRRLGEAIRRDRRLVIVGAGFIGLEVAATARKLGAEVTVLEPLQRPLAARLGAHTADRLLALHEAEGVEIHLGVGVESVAVTDDGARVRGVITNDGALVESPTVLVAIGCAPDVGWLEGSGLEISDGVECDAYCQAGPHVWAAGDVARWHHQGIGAPLRLEHRMNAAEQGIVVAANIMGEQRPFTPVPFFWTDHYRTKIQLAGVVPPGAEERAEVDGEEGSFVRSFWDDGRLVGAVGWNAAKALMPLRRALESGDSGAEGPVPVAGGQERGSR